jgi:hypothetical protein
MSDERSFFQQHLGGYIAAAAVVAFVVSPVMPIANANSLLLIGSLVALGITATWDKPTSRGGQIYAVVGIVALIAAMAFAAWTFVFAAGDAVANNARCLVYEQDMTAARPKWTNSRDLFQAFGCHGQPTRLAQKQGGGGTLLVGGAPAPSVQNSNQPPGK